MEYETNGHCKYLIALHLILVVKYRKPLLVGDIGESVKNSFLRISEKSEFKIEEIEIDKDHVHARRKSRRDSAYPNTYGGLNNKRPNIYG